MMPTITEQTSLLLLLPTINFLLLELEENLWGWALPELDKVLAGEGRLKVVTSGRWGLVVHHVGGQFVQ